MQRAYCMQSAYIFIPPKMHPKPKTKPKLSETKAGRSQFNFYIILLHANDMFRWMSHSNGEWRILNLKLTKHSLFCF